MYEGPGGLRVSKRLEHILRSWEGTGYIPGQRSRGVAADCVGFVTGVLDELDGRERGRTGDIPPDAAFHSPLKAWGAIARLRRLYKPCKAWRGNVLEPADIVVVGPTGGGPAHIMLVGPRPNTLWHCSSPFGVKQAGWALEEGREILHIVYRLADRRRWVR